MRFFQLGDIQAMPHNCGVDHVHFFFCLPGQLLHFIQRIKALLNGVNACVHGVKPLFHIKLQPELNTLNIIFHGKKTGLDLQNVGFSIEKALVQGIHTLVKQGLRAFDTDKLLLHLLQQG